MPGQNAGKSSSPPFAVINASSSTARSTGSLTATPALRPQQAPQRVHPHRKRYLAFRLRPPLQVPRRWLLSSALLRQRTLHQVLVLLVQSLPPRACHNPHPWRRHPPRHRHHALRIRTHFPSRIVLHRLIPPLLIMTLHHPNHALHNLTLHLNHGTLNHMSHYLFSPRRNLVLPLSHR